MTAKIHSQDNWPHLSDRGYSLRPRNSEQMLSAPPYSSEHLLGKDLSKKSFELLFSERSLRRRRSQPQLHIVIDMCESCPNSKSSCSMLPPPTKYFRKCLHSDEGLKCDHSCYFGDRHQQFLAAHRAAISESVLQNEPANWTAKSGLSDEWMWDLHAM